jgi:hypothetical protein
LNTIEGNVVLSLGSIFFGFRGGSPARDPSAEKIACGASADRTINFGDVGFHYPHSNPSFIMSKELGYLFVFSDPQGSEISDEEFHDWYDNVSQLCESLTK